MSLVFVDQVKNLNIVVVLYKINIPIENIASNTAVKIIKIFLFINILLINLFKKEIVIFFLLILVAAVFLI